MKALDLTPKILCHYSNQTTQFQIVRISNISGWFFERSVFPKGSIIFEAFPNAQLEVHTGEIASAILSDTIPCDRLVFTAESPAKHLRQIRQSA